MTTQGGALTQVIALGAADKYLTQNPTITYWRFKYNKYTNFALEAIEQAFQTQVMFGSDTQLTLNRTGDMIYWTYILVDLPGIQAGTPTASPGFYPALPFSGFKDPCGDAAATTPAYPEIYPLTDELGAPLSNWAVWTNAIGQWIVRRASIVIGGQQIDSVYSDYLFMWEELSGKPGKRLAEMIGKEVDLANRVEDSKLDRRLYVPVPFWFTQVSGNALPVVALQFHGVQIYVSFADLTSCIQTSVAYDPNSNPLYPPVQKISSGQALQDSDLRASVETTYVYLDIEERDRLSMGSFEQLITQVQSYSMIANQQQVRLSLNFNHPVIELIWGIKRVCQTHNNNQFVYSGVNQADPIKAVSLKLNNLPRFAPKEGRYFRLVQPYQSHTNIPSHYVYSYSFALHPEDPQPSGSCNFSRIDNIELTFEMQDRINQSTGATGLADYQVIVYARSWNVLRFRDGLAGLAFSN
jgi:hypothetical protein